MKLEEQEVVFLINFLRKAEYKLGQSSDMIAAENLHEKLIEYLNSNKKG